MERELVARISTLLAGQGLTATTVGDYSHTEMAFHNVNDKTPPVVTDAIWESENPWAYPLEQMAQSYVLTYANDTEERWAR